MSANVFSGFLQNQLVYLYHPATQKWVFGALDSTNNTYAVYPNPPQKSIFVMMDSPNPTQTMQAKLDFSSSDFAVYDITTGFSTLDYSALVGWLGNTVDLSQSTMINLFEESSLFVGPILIRNSSGDPFLSTDIVCPSTQFSFYITGSLTELLQIPDDAGVLQDAVFQAIPVDPSNIKNAPSGHRILYQCTPDATKNGNSIQNASTFSCSQVDKVDDPLTWTSGCLANALVTYTDSACGTVCAPYAGGYECTKNKCVESSTSPAPYATRADCTKACGSSPPGPSPAKSVLSVAAIVGIVVAAILVLAVIAGIAYFFFAKSKRKTTTT
jgi:hypothetical protein